MKFIINMVFFVCGPGWFVLAGLPQERVQGMYICICNAYRESKVRDVIQEGCDRSGGLTVEQIFARLGRGPRCGSCSSHVEDMIASAQEERDHAVTV